MSCVEKNAAISLVEKHNPQINGCPGARVFKYEHDFVGNYFVVSSTVITRLNIALIQTLHRS